MRCHSSRPHEKNIENEKIRILLMGNPNVGKSVIFSKLTGVNVVSSNYVGTTVDYTVGDVSFGRQRGVMIDVPGVYSLEATSEAEKVAVSLLEEGADVIVCVLDATHLERNLLLAYQLREYQIPIVYSLNLLDVAERQGIKIDAAKLSEELGAPVIPTVAIKNAGLMDLLRKAVSFAKEKAKPEPKLSDEERWLKIKDIVAKVQTEVEKKTTFMDL